MPKRELRVFLPADWHEVSGESPRAFRRTGERSGWLRVSLQPPERLPKGNGPAHIARLHEILRATKMDLGAHVASHFEPCTAGEMAFSTYRSATYGLLQFWLIPAEVTIFGSFIAGDPETAHQEVTDAHAILQSAHFESA